MKLKNISIKWRIFFIFIAFAIVLLGVLWFFQIIYLNDFYRFIKTKETEAVINKVEYLLENEDDCLDEIDTIAASNNMAIYITDTSGNALFTAEYISNSRMSSLPKKLFVFFYNQALENDGQAIIEYHGSQMMDEGFPPRVEFEIDIVENESDGSERRLEYTIPKNSEEQEGPFKQNLGNDMAESVIYVRTITVAGNDYVLMLNSVLTPVDATVSTLKSQLLIISVIMLIVALVGALILSMIISKSIIRLNDGAKKLAEGDYSVQFDSRDYQEVSQLSDTLNFAASELAKTDALQKELIANVSHDLRTPLTMVKGYAEVMRDIPGENTPENVQIIVDETERLTSLVNDMLDISKLKAGTITIEPDKYNITSSIRSLLQRYNKLREQDGYIIDFIYDNDIEIVADESKMNQVLYNLINNAINYTGEDKRVTVIQSMVEGKYRIDVKDTGDGVSQEDIPFVWDRYYKATTNHVRAKTGSGLGLSIVKNILELHGAKYGVSSIKGQGADFWFEMDIDPFDSL